MCCDSVKDKMGEKNGAQYSMNVIFFITACSIITRHLVMCIRL